ncbi:hypothetical protein [Microbacterium phyllosphaerae]
MSSEMQNLTLRRRSPCWSTTCAHRDGRRFLTAFPSVENPGSNGLYRPGGFELVGTIAETFRGTELTMNEWVLDLEA